MTAGTQVAADRVAVGSVIRLPGDRAGEVIAREIGAGVDADVSLGFIDSRTGNAGQVSRRASAAVAVIRTRGTVSAA